MPRDFRGVKTGKVPSAEKIPLSSCYSAKWDLRAEQKILTERISLKKFRRKPMDYKAKQSVYLTDRDQLQLH